MLCQLYLLFMIHLKISIDIVGDDCIHIRHAKHLLLLIPVYEARLLLSIFQIQNNAFYLFSYPFKLRSNLQYTYTDTATFTTSAAICDHTIPYMPKA